MPLLKFIFTLGFIYITFDVLWNIFLWGIKTIFGLDKREGWLYFILKGLSLYLLVALTSITTQNHLSVANSKLSFFAYPAIGLIVLYFYITSSMQKSRLRARIKMDVTAIKKMRFDGWFLFSALVLFSLSLFFPELKDTQLTRWVFNTIEDIYDILLFRWIIGLLAFFFLVNILIKGILATRMLLFSIFGWEPQEGGRLTDRLMQEKRQSTPAENQEGYTDYEIVEDNDDNKT